MIFDALTHDAEIASLVGDDAQARAMAEVEAALARAQGSLGVILPEAAAAISAAALALEPDAEILSASVARSGTPVLGLVRQLKEAVAAPHDGFVHWGVTSQDIVDTAMVLSAKVALSRLEGRLRALITVLGDLARAHRDTPMAGRTRFQQAVPVTFGLRVATWIAPLLRHLDRLDAFRPRLLVVQLGGAAGTLAALGGRGLEVAQGLARELDLGVPSGPWHSQRDTIAELGAWLALVAGSRGKIGADTVLLAQSEVGELAEGGDGHGASSTMPQKANPVLGEALMAIGRLAAGRLPALYQAQIHKGERDGAAWQMEWLELPELFALAGAALGNGERLARGLRVNEARMAQNLEASGGLIMAEAAAFALARTMPLADAQATVGEAAKAVAQTGGTLMEVLTERLGPQVDISSLGDVSAQTGESGALVDRVLSDIAARLDK